MGNFNNDPFDDVAFSKNTDVVEVLLGKSDGSFDAAGLFPVGEDPGYLVAGDLDNDEILDLAGFNSQRDRLWLVGDLVNRGPQSLETLRFIRDLGDTAITVLGNHDLHLLIVAAGFGRIHWIEAGDLLETD